MKTKKTIQTLLIIWVIGGVLSATAGPTLMRNLGQPVAYSHIPQIILPMIFFAVVLGLKCPHCSETLYTFKAIIVDIFWKTKFVPEKCDKCGKGVG